jgi:hypothetical protein
MKLWDVETLQSQLVHYWRSRAPAARHAATPRLVHEAFATGTPLPPQRTASDWYTLRDMKPQLKIDIQSRPELSRCKHAHNQSDREGAPRKIHVAPGRRCSLFSSKCEKPCMDSVAHYCPALSLLPGVLSSVYMARGEEHCNRTAFEHQLRIGKAIMDMMQFCLACEGLELVHKLGGIERDSCINQFTTDKAHKHVVLADARI